MNVEALTLDDARDRLGEFIERTDHAIYAHPTFLDFLTRATGGEALVLLAEADGETIGAFPHLTLTHPRLGSVVNSLPWYGSHGACLLDGARPDADTIRRALLNSFRDHLKVVDILSSTVILSHQEEPHRALYVEALSPTAIDARVGQVTALPPEPGANSECLMSVFKQKTRNLVRKGLKQGFTEHVADDDAAWDTLHRLHSESMNAIGATAKPRAHFEALRSALPASMRRLSLAMDGNTPVAALLLLCCGSTVEYLTPAADAAYRARQPLSFLIWHGMLNAIDHDRRTWNWGGTWKTQHSLHHFKAGFGAEDQPYSYLITAPTTGLAALRAQRDELGDLFPYFYTYPYAALDDPS